MKKNKKKKALFIAYLAVVLPANSAMCADWQSIGPLASAEQIQQDSTAPAQRYFQITNDDVAAEVAKQMQEQGFKQKVSATLALAASKVVYSADHPLKLAVHSLQVDDKANLWQAQAYIIAGNATESVKPISGRYEAVVSVPMLIHQMHQGDKIEASDIEMHDVAERQLRKDTVTNAKDMIGLSPRRIVSAERPVRMAEIALPVVVKKGQAVEMTYSTPYLSIRASGTALEDGSTGDMVRVKNDKSDKAVSGKVAGAGHIEVNSEAI